MAIIRKFGILLSLFCTGSMWFYSTHILVAHQQAMAAAQGTPRGNLSDLYPRWLGARELLIRHRDPYSEPITQEIQAGYYGRPLVAENPSDPRDQQAFAYPAYVIFLLAPTIHMPFPSVQRGYMRLLWLLTAVTVLLWAFLLRWRPGPRTLVICIILTLGSVPVVQGLKLQQLSLFTAFLLTMCFAAVSRGWLFSAGGLLAAATIKPQLAWLAVILLLGWVIRDWHKRKRLAWSFLGSMTLLFAGSQIILPGWLGEFCHSLLAYREYTQNVSLLGWIFTPLIGNLLGFILLIVAAKICWPLLREPYSSPEFAAAAALTMALTVVVVPMVAPYNQILLLPAVFLSAQNANHLWGQGKVVRLLFSITAALLVWPWAASLSLIVVYAISPQAAEWYWRLPFGSSFTFPLLLFGLVAFYVSRYAAKCGNPVLVKPVH